MNPVEAAVRHVDRWQQRQRVPGFLFAVVKKFGDDEAGNLVSLLTYFAFLATFPLLLALVGVLGIVLGGHPALQQRILNSAFTEFPIVGDQLRTQLGVNSLHHSGPALVIGIIVAILGGRGLANAVQNTLNTVWQVPKKDRPGFPEKLLRSLALLALLAIGAVLTAAAATIAALGQDLLGLHGLPLRFLGLAATTLLDIGLFLAAFRVATARIVGTRDMILGAVLSAIAWQGLLLLAGILVTHVLRHAQAIAGFFGVVLGLLAWFGLQATVTVYAVEADVVRVRHLWPRSITQPPLTDADKQYLETAMSTEVRRPEQQISIDFTPDADGIPPAR